ALIAGGTAEPTDRTFTLVAEAGSSTYGICSNRFLEKEFKTVRYELTVTILDKNRFHYKEDTQLRMPGQTDLFHHTDENTLTRIME
ncbi:MAG: FABP family protein, partial [Nitrospira sp.]|nr:FABP family protein [Nitrospira sp.]